MPLRRLSEQKRNTHRKAVREEKDKERKAQDHHKFMMGGCVQKYFPEGFNVFDFNELEMNRIIACAFSLKDVQNMINTVIVSVRRKQPLWGLIPPDANIIKERPDPDVETDGEEVADDEAESDDIEAEEKDDDEENWLK